MSLARTFAASSCREAALNQEGSAKVPALAGAFSSRSGRAPDRKPDKSKHDANRNQNVSGAKKLIESSGGVEGCRRRQRRILKVSDRCKKEPDHGKHPSENR